MAFAEPTHVETAYEGTLPAGSEARVQYLLDTASARLRVLLPTLVERIADDESGDLELLTRDVVVQAVLRRLPGNTQSVQSQTQSAGPWAVTTRYTQDTTGTFSDEDLRILGGTVSTTPSGSVGTIRIGPLVDWYTG